MRALAARLPGRPDRTTVAVLLIAAGALALRTWDLGSRAMHHDESLHAWFAWSYERGDGYVHDPLMHGPLQFHLLAGSFRLFGDGEVTARLPAALAGAALVCTPLLWRRWLGPVGTTAAAGLIALSPVLLYYSRFARNDAFSALWTALLFGAAWRYRDDGRRRWLVLIALSIGLGLSTKESTYLSIAVLLLWLHVGLARSDPGWARGEPGSGAAGEAGSAAWARGALRRGANLGAILGGAWLRALRSALRPARGAERRGAALSEGASLGAVPPEAASPGEVARRRMTDLLVVVGTLVAPTLGALVQPPLGLLGVDAGEDTRALAITAAIVLTLASAAIGLRWRPRLWPLLALVAYGVAVPLYASLGSHLDGVGGLFWNSLEYWLDQQDVQRGNQPWGYYLMMLPLYEPLSLLWIAAGLPWWRRVRGGPAGLLGWWLLGTLVALTLAGEKMPWLVAHLALPAALAGGLAVETLGGALRRWWPRATAAGGAAIGAVAALALIVGLYSVRSGLEVSFRHSDLAVEPLIYTQTAPDVPELLAVIEAYTAARDGRDHPIVIDGAFSVHWPWAWYLRDYSQVTYAGARSIDLPAIDPRAIVIAPPQSLVAFPDAVAAYPERREYRHRAWFPEHGYRAFRPGDLFDGDSAGRLGSFLSGRIGEAEVGALRALALFPEPLDRAESTSPRPTP